MIDRELPPKLKSVVYGGDSPLKSSLRRCSILTLKRLTSVNLFNVRGPKASLLVSPLYVY